MALDYDYLDKAFEEAAKTYGIDPDILRGIGYAESQFNPAAVNPKSGAAGMMQFMPGTAKQFGINPNDPVEAIFGAAAHLKRDLDRFGGDYNKAIAAYNWGPNRDAYNQPEWHKALPDETFKYVNRVLNYATGQDEGIARMPIKPKLRPMEPAQQVEGEPVAPQPQAAPAQPKPAQPEAEPERTFTGTAGDVGAAMLKSAIGVPQMAVGLADLVSGGAAGKKLEELGFRPEEAKKIIDEVMSSDAQKAARARVQQSEGFVERAKALGTNPSVLAESVVESIFPMLAGGVIGRGVKAATGMGALKAGAIGEGAATAGGMAAKMREESPDKELSAKQALSAVGAGVGTGVLGVAGGKLAEKLKLADIDTMIVGGADDATRAAAAAAKRGFTARVVGSGISEGVFEELPQSSQEQMWENYANDRPLTQGVPEAAATGLMAGAVMGGVTGGLVRPRAEAAAPEAEPSATAPAAPTPEQLYDAQYSPIDAEGRRIVEEAEAEPGVPEPVVRGREPVAEAAPVTSEVEPTAPAVPEPTVRAPVEPPLVAEQDVDRTLPADQITLTMPDIRRLAQQAGYGPKALSGPTGKWWEDNVAGRTLAEAQALIKAQPSLLKGNGSRAVLLSQLAIPDVVRPAVETNEEIAAKIAVRDAQPAPEVPNVPTTAVPTQEGEARVRSATVGSGAGAGPAVPVETGTRVEPAAGAEPPAEVRVDRPAQLPARTDAGTTAQPAAVTEPTAPAEADPELERLRPLMSDAVTPETLAQAKDDWNASIERRLDEAKTRWETDTALQREENPKARVQDWDSLPIERKYEAAKVIQWDALPDERKAEWADTAAVRYGNKQSLTFYLKRFNQISDDVMREPPKPLPPAKTREENLTYPSLAKAQEVSTQLESRIEAIRQERKVLATTNEKGETVPPADGTEEGLKYDKLTSQITQLENRKALADRDIDIYALRLQQEVGESPKPLPPPETRTEELTAPYSERVLIARNNVNRAYDRGDIDAPAAGKLYSMIEAGKAKQVTAMLNRLRTLTAEPGTTGALSDLRQNKTSGPRAVDFVRDLFSEYGEGAPIPKASYDAVEAGNASEALNVLAQQGTNEVVRETAARIAPLLANTRAELVDNLQTPDGKAAAGAAAVDGTYIRLDRNRGMDEETLVHEGVHAAAERVISAPEAELTEPQRSGKRELNAVWAAARNDTSIPLTEVARADVSEFASEAMSKKAVQDALRGKTLPESGNLWARFKRAVMRMVGLHQPKNMRDAVVDAMDKVFTAVPERAAPSRAAEAEPGAKPAAAEAEPEAEEAWYSLSPEVKRAVDAMPKKTRPIATGFIKATSPSISDVGITDYLLGAVDKYVRTNVMDKMATLELYVGRAEGYAVRNAAGEVKPLLQMRQAYDTDKLTQDLFIDGAIRFDPATRQFSTVDVKDTTQWSDDGLPRYAPDDLPTAVAAWAKKNRMSFDEAWGTYLPKIFEAVRLHNIAKEAEAAGVKSKVQPHLSKDFIAKAVADYEADADLKEITAIMDAPRVRMIEVGVETGRWTRKEADRLIEVVGYVPFDRLAEAGELGSPDKRTKAGVASFGKIPELVGTTQFEVKNVFENYFNTLSFLMAEAVKNGASISTLRYMEKLGLAKHIGANPAAVQHKGRTVAAHIDGVLNFFEVPDRQTVMAFKYDTVPADGVRKLLGATSKFFRASITLFPTFSAKQVVDDVQRAAMTAGGRNVAAVTASALEGYASLTKSQVTGERNPLVQKFGRKGLTAEIDWERQNPATSYLKDRGFQARGVKVAGIQVPFTSTLAELAHRLDGIAHASDLAVRNAVYEQVKKETGDEARAIAAARELINFRRQGASSVLTNYLIPSLPFFNAKLQGIDIMYRALTGRGAASGMSKHDALKSIATRGALALTVGTIYALAKAGDDEYENLSLEKRDRVWVLGGGVALPVPMEHAVLFKMIPERALEYFRRKGGAEEQAASEAFVTWFNTAFMTYAGSPLTVPQAWKPLFENFVNYSFFTNRPLVGKHLEGVDRSEQAVASTSEFAKGLAAWTRDNIPGQPQISPIHVDNFVSGYFGSVGAAFNMVVDMFANPDKLDRPIHRVVGLGAFTYDPESSTRRKDEFYKLREDAAKAHTTLLKIGTEGGSEKYRKYEAKLAPVLEAYAMTNKTLETLTNIRQEMNALQGNKEVIASYLKAAEEEVGPAKARSLAKDRREAEVLRLRAAEREMTGWVRSAVAEINKEKRRLKAEGINLDATP